MLETYVEQGGFGVSRLKIKVKYLIGDLEQAGLAFPALPPPLQKEKTSVYENMHLDHFFPNNSSTKPG